MQGVQAREWRRYGFGGPPQPWEHDAQRDLDRLATSYSIDILAARERLRGIAIETPLEPAPSLAAASGAAEVRLKLEALQPTGSFKIRGAHNKLALLAAERAAGTAPNLPLVTASSGNHGI